MPASTFSKTWPFLLFVGCIAGVGIATVDNVLSKGEVSPIVIVALLFVATLAAGIVWVWRGIFAATGTWMCVPLAHIIKHLLGLPDTLHPNTYASIMLLAVFTLVVAAIGLACGVFIHHLPFRNANSA
jgi:hypothetical protein